MTEYIETIECFFQDNQFDDNRHSIDFCVILGFHINPKFRIEFLICRIFESTSLNKIRRSFPL